MAIFEKLKRNWDSWLIGVSVFLFHAWHIPAMVRSQIIHDDNLAFDFDVGRFVSIWGETPPSASAWEDYFSVRHTLVPLVRLITIPLVRAGMDPRVAVCGVAAFCAAISAVLTFRIALLLGIRRGLTYVLTALWSVSTTSLILGAVPEAYDLALVAIALQFLLAIHWTLGREPGFVARVALAVANLGITVTNVVLCGLSELVCRLMRQTPRQALLGTVRFGIVAGLIGIVLSVAAFQIWPVRKIDGSVIAVKQLYWAVAGNKGPEHPSLIKPAWSFGAVAFVAPPPARYPTFVPTGDQYLYDVRGHAFGWTGWVGLAGWLGLLALGLVAAARDKQFRPVWIIAAVWVAGNIGLHSFWQYRDSLFIYSAHSHIAFFILAMAGARWAQQQRNGAMAYGGAAALVTLFVALNNLPIYWSLPGLN